ncbi:hypothetical protein CKAH01_01159 [Colletotrichum kahawae]|uniref:Uncharacterized protein n=1 Tax=Colletotrichum kahawae TaxID=34407 RepID=A0AAD9YCQ3_COLKA|nr:hypothetical protein CKAH01_01159 [Colletotrichum kahawae]
MRSSTSILQAFVPPAPGPRLIAAFRLPPAWQRYPTIHEPVLALSRLGSLIRPIILSAHLHTHQTHISVLIPGQHPLIRQNPLVRGVTSQKKWGTRVRAPDSKKSPQKTPSVPTTGRRTLPRPSPRYLLSLSLTVSVSLSLMSWMAVRWPCAADVTAQPADAGRREGKSLRQATSKPPQHRRRGPATCTPVCRMLRRTAVGHWTNMVRRASLFRLCMLALGDVAYVCGMQVDTFGR